MINKNYVTMQKVLCPCSIFHQVGSCSDFPVVEAVVEDDVCFGVQIFLDSSEKAFSSQLHSEFEGGITFLG